MGLVPVLLNKVPKIGKKCALAFACSKLVWRCVQTGWRPLRLIEKIGVFYLDRRHVRISYTYWVVRMLFHKQMTANQVESAMLFCMSPPPPDDYTHTGMPVNEIISLIVTLDKADEPVGISAKSYSGFKFIEYLINKRAVDSSISARYTLDRGRFDVHRCFTDYYNSPRMQDFLDVVKEGQEEHCIDKKQLTKQGARVYEEIQKRQLYDTIDLLVL